MDVTFTPHTAPLYKENNLMFDCRGGLIPGHQAAGDYLSSVKPLNLDRRNPGYPILGFSKKPPKKP
jgi:hypothetical protein